MVGIGHNYNKSMNVPRELEFSVMYSDLTPQARHIIHVLAKLMTRDGANCKPSVDGLVKFTGLGRSTVLRKLKEVDEWGRIEREITSRTSGTKFIPNVELIKQDLENQSVRQTPIDEELPSLLVSEGHQGLVSERHQESTPWCQSDTGLVSERHPTKDITKEVKEKEKTKKKKTKINYTKAFEQLYKSYPKQSTKAESFKVWKQLSSDDQTWATGSIPAYKKFLAEDGGWRKPQDLVRYLNKRTFEDYPISGSESKDWGWWRSEKRWDKLTPEDWRNMIRAHKPNGVWPWETLGPPPGHPECLLPELAQDAYGDKYSDQVEELTRQHGEKQ